LYRIATNRCLNALRDSSRRPARPPVAAKPWLPEPTHRGSEPVWLEPYPDLLMADLPDRSPGPAARYEQRESVSLAFLSALQHLPARQRAVLVLRDVLGYRAAEAAEMLGTTSAAVNSALSRARATLAAEVPAGPDREAAPAPGSALERQVAARFVRAFESGDIDAVVALLTDDVLLTMPPLPLEYRGAAAAGNFLRAPQMASCHRYVLVATRANGQPAYGCYLRTPDNAILHGHGVMVLTLAGGRISGLTRFTDNALLPVFGLPRSLRYGGPARRPGNTLTAPAS
jgi:RNA polymerase sigma-70 factor (ECF subfamily)